MGGPFGLSTTEHTHKSFSVQIELPDACLVSGDMSTPNDPSVLKGDCHHVLTV